jgi:ubiquinone/menaquinone biosynthesis C-methylase UbiE
MRMSLPELNDRRFTEKQYQDFSNLDARVRLHERFSLNPYRWHAWAFDHLEIPPEASLLELGCGPAALWSENIDRIPPGWQITLSDFSTGMLDAARRNLSGKRPFKFEQFDAQSIPFATATFDAVIANHMLYHVPDMGKALSEIRRVLNPSGLFYASTNGESHLKELRQLVRDFDSRLTTWGVVAASFTLENGAAQLSEWFPQVDLYRYLDALDVTEVDPLVDYVLSGSASGVLGENIEGFRELVEAEMNAHAGIFHITKEAGLFVCPKFSRPT